VTYKGGFTADGASGLQAASMEVRWALSRERRVRQVRTFIEHGYRPFSNESLEYLKNKIERLAPEQHGGDRAALFRSFEKRASAEQRYFVYQTLLERLLHKDGPRRRPGRPDIQRRRRALLTESAATAEIHEIRAGRLIRRRIRDSSPLRGRLLSDLHAFLSPVYGSEKSYGQIVRLLRAVFDEPVIADASVKREILRNRRSALPR
jgi:hypothetical protein